MIEILTKKSRVIVFVIKSSETAEPIFMYFFIFGRSGKDGS